LLVFFTNDSKINQVLPLCFLCGALRLLRLK
jgi:hypothetical protein